jgi:hypothetical protein
MANTVLLLNDLSFSGIKNSLRAYLSQQGEFTDYNFEGSNLAALVDLLAYNTQQNGYMLNMIFNEGFIDSAQTYDAIASHAKELSYTPRSQKSSRAVCTVSVTPPAGQNPSSIIIPANTVFSSRGANSAYSFRTTDPFVLSLSNVISSGGSTFYKYSLPNISVYEGPIFTETYVANNNDQGQEFTIFNSNVDTESIVVTVGGSNYNRATSLLDFTNESNIFFVETTYNSKYKVTFGDGTIGRKPDTGAFISISYRVPAGEPANGIANLIAGTIGGYSNVQVQVTSNSAGGAPRESVSSIKYYAPRWYQTRERAVTVNDYETLLKVNFPEIKAINVYGGDELDPPQFGKVALSIDLADADGVSKGRQDLYSSFLRNRSPVTIQPIFIDPEFLNIKVNSTVKFDPAITLVSSFQLQTAVLAAISQFNITNLQDFNTTLYLSRLMEAINKVNPAIVSNETTLTMQKTIELKQNNTAVYSTLFYNSIEPGSLQSTAFTFNKDTCFFGDSNGSVQLFSLQANTTQVITANAGLIDYNTGRVDIRAISISSVSGTLTFTATPQNQDISSKQNSIIQIDMDQAAVQAIRK